MQLFFRIGQDATNSYCPQKAYLHDRFIKKIWKTSVILTGMYNLIRYYDKPIDKVCFR